MEDLSKLLDFAVSDRQRQVLEAVIEHGSNEKAAKAIGAAKSTVWHHIDQVRKLAALQGYAPENDLVHTVDSAHILKGASTLYDETGTKRLQWVKTDLKREALLNLMREVADELKADIKPQKPIELVAGPREEDLLNLHIMTDIHLGMRAWSEECGANWDMDICERVVVGTQQKLLTRSPRAGTGFLMQLGDAFHYDGQLPVTPTSNHVLDVDSRHQLMIRTGIRLFRTVINLMLEKYERVILLHCQGNHDLASAAWLQEWFSVLYEDEPRIQVIVNPNPYYAYVHRKVLLGAHHGHKRVNLKKVCETFFEQFRFEHGHTETTHIHTGHLHTDDHYYSFGNTRAERHETIAAGDAYAVHGGWRTSRSMKVITYDDSREKGRVVEHP